MLPAPRSLSTVTPSPTNPTITATMVDGVSRSPRKRANNTATSGVSELRNDALAGVVVFTA